MPIFKLSGFVIESFPHVLFYNLADSLPVSFVFNSERLYIQDHLLIKK